MYSPTSCKAMPLHWGAINLLSSQLIQHQFFQALFYSCHIHTSANICMDTLQAGNHHLLQILMICHVHLNYIRSLQALLLTCIWIQCQFRGTLLQRKVFEILLFSTELYLNKIQLNKTCKKCDCLSLLFIDRNLIASTWRIYSTEYHITHMRW